MDESVIVTIGGEAIAVPPMCFAALKRAWPAIQAMPACRGLIDQASTAVAIVAAAVAAVRPELTVAAIEERLKGAELTGLVTQVPALLASSGLVPAETKPPGEPAAGP